LPQGTSQQREKYFQPTEEEADIREKRKHRKRRVRGRDERKRHHPYSLFTFRASSLVR